MSGPEMEMGELVCFMLGEEGTVWSQPLCSQGNHVSPWTPPRTRSRGCFLPPCTPMHAYTETALGQFHSTGIGLKGTFLFSPLDLLFWGAPTREQVRVFCMGFKDSLGHLLKRKTCMLLPWLTYVSEKYNDHISIYDFTCGCSGWG